MAATRAGSVRGARLYQPVAGEQALARRWWIPQAPALFRLYSAHAVRQTCTVTAAFTSEKLIAQWYIDVYAGHGVDHTGVPWHDDLYLDHIARKRGATALEAALAAGAVGLPAYQSTGWRRPLTARICPDMR
jgi:hypothetical protein